MQLYRIARDFPESLRGEATIVGCPGLAGHGLTPSAARWRASHHRIERAQRGTYLLGPTDLVDRARAALTVCPAGTMIGFHTAAALQGFGVIEDRRIHVVVPAGAVFPWRPEIRVHQSVLVGDEPELSCGIGCTPPARTAIELARILPRPQALSILDAALFAKACDSDGLRGELLRHRGLPGSRRVRALIDRADGRSECAQETHLRLVLHDAGLTGFVPQHPVYDDYGEYVRYRIDLAAPERRVAAEYDGKSHDAPGSRSRDRRRHNWLDGERHWRMRYFTDADLYHDTAGIVRIMRAALADRR